MLPIVKQEYEAAIIQDEYPESPREWDNLGTMVCFHSRYNLGDPHNFKDSGEFLFSLLEDMTGDCDEAERLIDQFSDELDMKPGAAGYARALVNKILDYLKQETVILPLYLYDHSGMTMNTSGFHCPWDSGQVGWIYADKDTLLREYGSLNQSVMETAEMVLENEVKIYDCYLTGETYGIEFTKEGEEIESIYGFYGRADAESNIEIYTPQEVKTAVENGAAELKIKM